MGNANASIMKRKPATLSNTLDESDLKVLDNGTFFETTKANLSPILETEKTSDAYELEAQKSPLKDFIASLTPPRPNLNQYLACILVDDYS